MSDTSSEEDSNECEEEKTDESDVDNNEDNHPGLSGMHKDTHIIPKENVIIYTVHLSVQTSQKYK